MDGGCGGSNQAMRSYTNLRFLDGVSTVDITAWAGDVAPLLAAPVACLLAEALHALLEEAFDAVVFSGIATRSLKSRERHKSNVCNWPSMPTFPRAHLAQAAW